MNSKVPNKVPNKTELAILELLSESPRMTSVQLAEHIGLSPRAIGKVIQSLWNPIAPSKSLKLPRKLPRNVNLQ